MLVKITLRDQVRKYLQELMWSKKLNLADRLSLADISRELQVSVTPVREALTQLEQSGIVEAIPNRGFFIPSLSVQEASEIYPIIAHLESLAVKSATYPDKQIKKLKSIQKKFKSFTEAENLVELDLQFHEALVEPFENNTVKRILADLKIRLFFYELTYMRSNNYFQNSTAQHDQIITLLAKGKTSKAAKITLKNWYIGLDFIKKHLNKEP